MSYRLTITRRGSAIRRRVFVLESIERVRERILSEKMRNPSDVLFSVTELDSAPVWRAC